MAASRVSGVRLEARRQRVLTRILEAGEVPIAQLADEFHVSLMTMHRDLEELARRQLIHKLRGRVAPMPPVTVETATRFRMHAQAAEKEAIAAFALREIMRDSTILMDDSTTLFPVARRLSEVGRVTVVTNSVGIAHILRDEENNEVFLLGGKYYPEFDSTAGPEVQRSLDRFHADTSLMSATAISGGRLYHPQQDYAAVKEAMLQSAGRHLLLLDHTKFGRRSTFAYGDVSHYHLVITTVKAPNVETKIIRDLGVPVVVANLDEQSGQAGGAPLQ